MTANLPPCGGDVRPFDKLRTEGGNVGATTFRTFAVSVVE